MSRVWDAFLVTMAMEFGDKTFFLATVLAQKRHPLLVFLGAAAALGLMTLGGTAFGVILPHFLPPILTDVVAALVYFVLGVVMMYEAITVDGNESEYESAQEIARNKKSELHASTFLQTMMLIVAAEWGDRSQVSTVSLASSGDFFGVEIFRYGLLFGAVLWMLFCRRNRIEQLKLAHTRNQRLSVDACFVTVVIALAAVVGVSLFPFVPGYEIIHCVFGTMALVAGVAANALQTISTRLLHGNSSRLYWVQIYLLIIFASLSVKSMANSGTLIVTPFNITQDRLLMAASDFSTVCQDGFLVGMDGSDMLAHIARSEWLLFASLSTFGFSMGKYPRMAKRMD
eukprot:GEMP01068459.1.p1 GENE.GEMP01068459.1~~GEMP01068459.1.p1  ORF type:complete len:342 (-),score=45.25 GEMP01068459.1:123-1148(-)